MPIVRIYTGEDEPPGAWQPVVDLLSGRLDMRLNTGPPQRSTESGDSPLIVVASGPRAVSQACSLAELHPELVRALILISGLPNEDAAPPAVPTLLVRGRQCQSVTHKEGIAAFENLQFGRIVELESCRDRPHIERPEALASTIEWFVHDLENG